mgnify:CR=1 FL=1
MKYITLLLVLLSITSCTKDDIRQELVVGTYQRIDNNHGETWIFNSDGTHIRYQNIMMPMTMTYTFDDKYLTVCIPGTDECFVERYYYNNGILTLKDYSHEFQRIE